MCSLKFQIAEVIPMLESILYLVYKHCDLREYLKLFPRNFTLSIMHVDSGRKLPENKVHIIKQDYIWKVL